MAVGLAPSPSCVANPAVLAPAGTRWLLLATVTAFVGYGAQLIALEQVRSACTKP